MCHLRLNHLWPLLDKRVFGRIAFAVSWMLIFAVGGSHLAAQSAEDISQEYAIKAAYIYNFSRYIQWPAKTFASADAPFVIGVLGHDPFGDIMEVIVRTKDVDKRKIVFKQFPSVASYTPCQILFITSGIDPKEKEEAVQKLRNSSVLLVGETPNFAKQGGIVNFYVEENKIHFEINAKAAEQEQLKISSKLLSLAKIVE